MCLVYFVVTFVIYVFTLVVLSGILALSWWIAFTLVDEIIESGERDEFLLWIRGALSQLLIFSHMGLATPVSNRSNRWRGRIVLGGLFTLAAVVDFLLWGWVYILWGMAFLLLLTVPDDLIDDLFA